ncbi:MAG: hypothetical protein ACLTMH_09730 [Faecalimonas umbilicata]|uniref:hypothetical protein n=1 Tax=Faecalimonas umbilicata TaxID=1912855 RepID=UPI003992DDBD
MKYNANQKYCTDGISAAMFQDICKQAMFVSTFTSRSVWQAAPHWAIFQHRLHSIP